MVLQLLLCYWWRVVRLLAITGSAFIRCINVVLWPTLSKRESGLHAPPMTRNLEGKPHQDRWKFNVWFMFFIPETVECKGWTTRLPQSPTWKCKEHCKSWNEPKDRAKVTPCLSETMQVNKSRSMRKWWRCQAAGSNCVHCIYIEWKLAQILTIRLRKYQSTNKIIKDGDISLLKLLSLLNSV